MTRKKRFTDAELQDINRRKDLEKKAIENTAKNLAKTAIENTVKNLAKTKADKGYEVGDVVEGFVQWCDYKRKDARVRIDDNFSIFLSFEQFYALGYKPWTDTVVKATLTANRKGKPFHGSNVEIIKNGKR